MIQVIPTRPSPLSQGFPYHVSPRQPGSFLSLPSLPSSAGPWWLPQFMFLLRPASSNTFHYISSFCAPTPAPRLPRKGADSFPSGLCFPHPPGMALPSLKEDRLL